MNASLRQFGAALTLGIAAAANADTIQATSAGLEVAETRYALYADFRLDLSASLVEALNHGLSLGFLVEFELSRPRWYWFDEKTATEKLELRLAYLPLAQQYRIGLTVDQLGVAQNIAREDLRSQRQAVANLSLIHISEPTRH